MDEQYPTNLFSAVAKNIVDHFHGRPATATIQKEASEDSTHYMPPDTEVSPEQEARIHQTYQGYNDFLSKYRFTPGQFAGDPAAGRFVDANKNVAAHDMANYFNAQAKMMGGMNTDLVTKERAAEQQLNDMAARAKITRSIESTMRGEAENPERFGGMVDLSNRSRAAFRHNKTTEVATPLAAAAGGIGGALLGRTPIRRGLFGTVGAVGAGLAGLAAGRASEEHQTGYGHSDVLPPYKIADRLHRRLQTDVKVN